eukprot:8874217-Pyramimonas_sp.AAC.1
MDTVEKDNLERNEQSPMVEGDASSPPVLTDTKRPNLLEDYHVFLNQQVTFTDFQPHYLCSPNLDVDDIDEYQNTMANMGDEAAHWVIPSPVGRSRCFYADMMTGESMIAQSDDVLTEAEIYQYWD